MADPKTTPAEDQNDRALELVAQDIETTRKDLDDFRAANEALVKRLETLEQRPTLAPNVERADSVMDVRKAIEEKKAALKTPDKTFTLDKVKYRFAVPAVYIDGKRVPVLQLLDDRSLLAETVAQFPNIVRPA